MESPPEASPCSSLGYAALIELFDLRCPPPRLRSWRSTTVRVVTRNVDELGAEVVTYPRSAYRGRSGMADHLEFALKTEPLELGVLAALFEHEPAREALQAWLNASPSSQYARLAGHLYEWLTERPLQYQLPAGAKRVRVLDSKDFVIGPEVMDRRFGVVHNLIGSRRMSPVVRRTPAINALLTGDLKARVARAIAAIDPQLLERAVTYLYLSETKSSFGIENEVPSHEKRERFRRLLERAGAAEPLTEDTWLACHKEILSEHHREVAYRSKQNWLVKGGSSRAVDYIPPAPEDVHALMEDVAVIAEQGAAGQLDPVIAAACASFGMVFVHPFLDGNGRLHRFLLHHVLRRCGVTPKGMVLPISAALLAALPEYAAVLQAYSQPRTRLLEYRLEPDTHTIEVLGPQPTWLYGYFDATKLCELVASCIEQALNVDLPGELAWLRAYDQAMHEVNEWLEGEQSQLDNLVRIILQNDGHLSKTKRAMFQRYSDRDIAKTEDIVRAAFAEWSETYGNGKLADVRSEP